MNISIHVYIYINLNIYIITFLIGYNGGLEAASLVTQERRKAE